MAQKMRENKFTRQPEAQEAMKPGRMYMDSIRVQFASIRYSIDKVSVYLGESSVHACQGCVNSIIGPENSLSGAEFQIRWPSALEAPGGLRETAFHGVRNGGDVEGEKVHFSI